MRGLFIAEKPSVAATVKKTYERIKDTLPYEIDFLAQRGHLLTLKYPEELSADLKEWSWDTLPIEPEKYGGWAYKTIDEKPSADGDRKFLSPKERLEKINEALMSGRYDFIINGGDMDQEGELLVRIVLEYLHNTLPVKRFWVDDLTDKLIADGLASLRDDDKEASLINLFSAAKARQHSDYRFGMNLSRAASLKFDGRVAVGRVKTAILNIVSKREDEIEGFVPSTKYGIEAIYGEGFSGSLFNPSAEDETDEEESGKDEAKKGLIWFGTREEAEMLISKLGTHARIESVEKKRQEILPPKLYTLATLQEAAGKLGITAGNTLDIAQALYEQGFMSYPRTDCEYVASSEDFTGILSALNTVGTFSPYVKTISKADIGRVMHTRKWVNDVALKEHDSGHTALRPTTLAPDLSKLTEEERMIYSLVARRFIAIFLKPMIQDRTKIVADIDGNKFRSSGKITIDKGYTEMFGISAVDAELPSVAEGNILSVGEYTVKEKTSVCPKRYSDGELVMACEKPAKYLEDESLKKLGKDLTIGTSATRAGIIEQLIVVDKYMERIKDGKIWRIRPTELGRAIIRNLDGLDICKVDTTGQWEEQLRQVRSGALSLETLEKNMRREVNAQILKIKALSVKAEIPKPAGAKSGLKTICKCPACGKGILEGKTSYFCPGYKDSPPCSHSIFKTIGYVSIPVSAAIKLFAGETVEVKASKTDESGKSHSWDQKVKYNSDTDRIDFIKAEYDEKVSSIHCPDCGELMTDKKSLYTCKCGALLWKSCFGNTLREETLKTLVEKGSVKDVHGFVSRRGAEYSADIKLVKKIKDGKAQYSAECVFK